MPVGYFKPQTFSMILRIYILCMLVLFVLCTLKVSAPSSAPPPADADVLRDDELEVEPASPWNAADEGPVGPVDNCDKAQGPGPGPRQSLF